MRNQYFSITAALFCATLAGGAHAKNLAQEQIPPPVLEKFKQAHPDAKELQAETVTHFRVPLIKLAFKSGEEQDINYYRPNGTFFVNGFIIESNEIPEQVQQSLKNEFADYHVNSASLIANPNGVGREYEIDLSAAGSNWEMIADESGAILGKDQE